MNTHDPLHYPAQGTDHGLRYFSMFVVLVGIVLMAMQGQLLSHSLLDPICNQKPSDFWETVTKKAYDKYYPNNKLPTPPLRCEKLTALERALQEWSFTVNPANFPSLPPNITVDDYRLILKFWQQMATSFEQLNMMDLERPVKLKNLIGWTMTSIIMVLVLLFRCDHTSL